jgi:hypothetical protein
MFLSAFATGIPLAAGFAAGHLPLATFGSLLGYLLTLNDHFGGLWHRVWVITLSGLLVACGFTLGFHASPEAWFYPPLLFGATYWLGLLGGEGAETERAFLFGLIGFLSASNTPGLTPALLPLVLPYALVGYACVAIAGPLWYLATRQSPEAHAGIRESLRRSLTSRYDRHVHAFSFAAAVLTAELILRAQQWERASWAVVTILIIMRPDRRLSTLKVVQRLVGTVLGVLVADAAVLLQPTAGILVLLLTACAFCVPWALRRNYWVASFFVTIFVILVLELGAASHGDLHLGRVRILGTMVGCGFCFAGMGLARTLESLRTGRPTK